jgi:hypothetical protein
MSAPPLAKLIRFILITVGLIILLSVLWSFVDQSYSDFLTSVAKSAVSKSATVEGKAGTIYFLHSIPYLGGSLQVTDWIDISAVEFGLVLVVALVAATPGLRLAQRFLYSGVAAVTVFVLHILAVVIMARTFSSIFFITVSDLVPPLLWALFSFRYWFPRKAPSESQRSALQRDPRNQPR